MCPSRMSYSWEIVLIPVFALGRAQELCILLESYWERMDLTIPIFFSQGLAEKANQYYRLFINWTNEKIKRTFVHRNMFDFKHIRPFDLSYADSPGPMVLFSTPGMLHGGQSLRVFKRWCSDEKNMVIMPGFCVAGTVGAKVIAGAKKIEIEGKLMEINLGVEYMSFSAHADAKGIMQVLFLVWSLTFTFASSLLLPCSARPIRALLCLICWRYDVSFSRFISLRYT
ncbi:Integrator complex subunit 11 [Toxocara canis]|uniref:Integrator complex subunit 11 n=1 Tax=Toxocara canis TaxID=6265 RepID=A0A0B2UPC7_TOXCA|nr:Integrator complex subunit 11 [Toxocara canis]